MHWNRSPQTYPPLASEQPAPWELFHENSKTGRFDRGLSNFEVATRMRESWESLPYEQYPSFELPAERRPLDVSLDEAITTRVTARAFEQRAIAFTELATLLFCAYGVTREAQEGIFPRPLRCVPSAGALYPLELYFHTIGVDELPGGLYHYNPSRNRVELLRRGDHSRKIAEGLVQPEIAVEATLIVFITAMFERATFKYRDRGYRFTLLEAGHVGQNINLAANGLGLGAANIGGYFDRALDELLGCDGLTHSLIYVVAVGGAGEVGADAP